MKIGGFNLNEKQFREQIINDLEKRGMMCINLHQGTLDAYIPISKKFIEFKMIKSFSHTPKTSGDFGIRFTKCETELLRKLNKLQSCDELPFIAIKDNIVNKGSFYLIYSDELKKYIEERKKFKRILISKLHFDNRPISYDDLLDILMKLKDGN